MRGINRLFLMGHLGLKPELKSSQNKTPFTDLRVATHRQTKNEDKWTQLTDWHRVRVWGNDAVRCCQLLQAGDAVAIEGHIRTDSWLNEDGEKKYFTLIHCQMIQFVRMAQRSPTLPLKEKASA